MNRKGIVFAIIMLVIGSTKIFGVQRRGGMQRLVSVDSETARTIATRLLNDIHRGNLRESQGALDKLKALRIRGQRPQWLNDWVRQAEKVLAERRRGGIAEQARELGLEGAMYGEEEMVPGVAPRAEAAREARQQDLEEAMYEGGREELEEAMYGGREDAIIPEVIGEFQRISKEKEARFEEEARRAQESEEFVPGSSIEPAYPAEEPMTGIEVAEQEFGPEIEDQGLSFEVAAALKALEQAEKEERIHLSTIENLIARIGAQRFYQELAEIRKREAEEEVLEGVGSLFEGSESELQQPRDEELQDFLAQIRQGVALQPVKTSMPGAAAPEQRPLNLSERAKFKQLDALYGSQFYDENDRSPEPTRGDLELLREIEGR